MCLSIKNIEILNAQRKLALIFFWFDDDSDENGETETSGERSWYLC